MTLRERVEELEKKWRISAKHTADPGFRVLYTSHADELAAALVAEGLEVAPLGTNQFIVTTSIAEDGHTKRYFDSQGKQIFVSDTSPTAAAPSLHRPFTEQEQAVISDLAKRLDISEHKVLVQGLRTYQLIVMGAYKLEEIDLELSKAAAPSLHKEPLGNDVLFNDAEINTLLTGRFGVSSVTGLDDIAWLTGQINKLVDVKRAALHKEGAGGECAYKKQHNIGFPCPHCGVIEPLPLQRTLPDEQFKGVVVEAMGADGERRTIQEVLRLHVDSSESMYETFKRVGDIQGMDIQSGVTAGLKRAIEVADNLAVASPAGRAEQPKAKE